MKHIIIFLIVLFIYVHWANQYKTSEDLEIYETDFKSNKHLNEICDLRQPVVFHYPVPPIQIPSTLKIKDITDIETDEYVYLDDKSANTLIRSDTKSRYYSEGNDVEPINDPNLKPFLAVRTKCDVLFGSQNARTAMKHHTNSRLFLAVGTGKIQVKMTPYKSRKFLKLFNDNGLFRSKMDVWVPQNKYLADYEQIQFLEFDVGEGDILYVPPYWFYSVRFTTPETTVGEIVYNTPINLIAFLPAAITGTALFSPQTV